MNEEELRALARRIRLASVEAIARAGKGHFGGSLSCADILAVLYGSVLKHDPKNPAWPERDRFVLSKGHAGIALYATLAEFGYFPRAELDHFNRTGILGEHPGRHIPGVEVSTGSLGHGLGVACGIAMEAKLSGAKWRTFALLSDGECWEGTTWEAAMFAAHHSLNITAIIDRNRLSIAGDTEDTLRLEPLLDKWDAFGWEVGPISGHNHGQLMLALNHPNTRPFCLIASTVKGKGVSFMESVPAWHHGSISPAQLEQARSELGPA